MCHWNIGQHFDGEVEAGQKQKDSGFHPIPSSSLLACSKLSPSGPERDVHSRWSNGPSPYFFFFFLHTNSVEICSLAMALSIWVWAKLQVEVQLVWPNADAGY